jgi:hypothetical protein
MQPPPQDQLNASAENPLKPAGQRSLPGHPGLPPTFPRKVAHRGWPVQRRRMACLSGVAAQGAARRITGPEHHGASAGRVPA